MIIQCPLDGTHMNELARSSAGKVFECPRCLNRNVLDKQTISLLEGTETAESATGEGESAQIKAEPELPTPQRSSEEQQEIAQYVFQEGLTEEQIALETSGQMENYNEAIALLAKVLEVPRSEIERRVKTVSDEPMLEDPPDDLSLEDIESCTHSGDILSVGEWPEQHKICQRCGVDLEEGWEIKDEVIVENPETAAAEEEMEEEELTEHPDGGFVNSDGKRVFVSDFGTLIVDEPFEERCKRDEEVSTAAEFVAEVSTPQTREELMNALATLDAKEAQELKEEQAEIDAAAEAEKSERVRKATKKKTGKKKKIRSRKRKTARRKPGRKKKAPSQPLTE